MTKTQAIYTLQDIERLLNKASRLNTSSPVGQSDLQRMQSEARRGSSQIQDIIRLIKRLDQEANG
jgi:hypothetical protein